MFYTNQGKKELKEGSISGKMEKNCLGRFPTMPSNPYTPGAGTKPFYLAGREDDLNYIETTLTDLEEGIPQQSVVYYGLRGVGKTVLLNEIQKIADNKDILNDFFEISEDGDFLSKLTLSVNKFILKLSTKENVKDKILKLFGIFKSFVLTWQPEDGSIQVGLNDEISPITGVADGHNLSSDFTDLLVALGEYAQMADSCVCFFIDEIQNMKKDELAAIISAIHRSNQKGLPIIVIGAGLPKIAKMAGDIKSYSERLFRFIQIDSLSNSAAKEALLLPAAAMNVTYTPAAVKVIIGETDGYPYFIQEFGKQVWSIKTGNKINKDTALNATGLFLKTLDESFFKVRFDRATIAEQEFMLSMARCGHIPCSIAEVASIINKSATSIAPCRAQLINKGLIYATRHGEIGFTVPHFDKFLRRNKPDHFLSN